MAKKTDKPAMAPTEILLGPVTLSREWAEQFGPGQGIEYTQAGVVLCSERQKHTIKIGDQPVGLTVSLYITREPVGQEEVNAVADVKAGRTAEKKAKEKEQAELLAREKRTMFDLGQQSSSQAIMGTLQNMGPLMNAAKLLKGAFPEA
jgi:hypothetical protein